jgi:uncharacterized protein (TIGR03083 family)
MGEDVEMTRTFAAWVEPIATQFRQARAELVAIARAMPEGVWEQPSPNEGWTYSDLLAHIAGDTDKRFLQALRTILARQSVDLAALRAGIDECNARNIEERRGRTIDELIAEIEADGEETQGLLARFTDADEDWQPEGLATTAGNALRGVSPGLVIREHLAQLRAAFEEPQ